MKNYFLLSGAMLLALGSCTNEINEEGFVDKTNTISFNAYPNKTRAVTGDVTTDNMKGDNFGVLGYYNNSPYLYVLDNDNTTKKAVEQYWKANGEGTSGTWEYKNIGDMKFWPDRNATMDFYAYFPYSDNATFVDNITTGSAVMTIPNQTCDHDVLFSKTSSTHDERVPLTFYHAFAKIQGVNIKVNGGNVGQTDIQVTIKDVEFINTNRSGSVKVDADGNASYDLASTKVTLSKNFSSPVTLNKSLTSGVEIISGSELCYLFATNSDATNNVKGTGNALWDGYKSSLNGGDLSTSNFVCLKLTCKVKDNTHYLVGSDGDGDNNYGVVYIPLTGSDAVPNTETSLVAGKRYTFNIVFSHNVGYKDNGDPILDPILFSVSSVEAWGDVNVTITL
ncbi:MAG: fimbrillin family protein [Prevotella sp.]